MQKLLPQCNKITKYLKQRNKKIIIFFTSRFFKFVILGTKNVYFQSLVIKNINNFIIQLLTILYVIDKYNLVDYILYYTR